MNDKLVDKLVGIALKDKKVLFARSRGKTHFYTLGGKRDPGESDIEALNREMQEEAGTQFTPSSVHHIMTLTGPCHGKAPDVVLQLTCYGGELESEPLPSSEIEEFKWVNSADMDKPYVTDMGRMILQALHERSLID